MSENNSKLIASEESNVIKADTNGGSAYPSVLSPESWFELIEYPPAEIDPIESPEKLSEQMYMLSGLRIRLAAQAIAVAETLPNEGELKIRKDAVRSAESALAKVMDTLGNNCAETMPDAFYAATDITISTSEDRIAGSILERLIDKSGYKEETNGDKENLLKKLTEAAVKAQDVQKEYLSASRQLIETEMAYIESKNMQSLKAILAPIYAQIQHLDSEITDLGTKIQLSLVVHSNKPEDTSV